MNKRIKFFVSVILIFAIFVSSFVIPASSFENDVETSTSDLFLVNLDTDTIVFSQKADTNWYAGGLSELMTFIIAYERIPQPETVTFKVEQSYLNALPHKDGCLDKFAGMTLTAKDLMAVMLLTDGNDAAYALADLAMNNDRDAFVAEMNDRLSILGCTSTAYVSPGFDDTSSQHTTCRDLYLVYTEARKNDFFREVMEEKKYLPEGLDEEEYTVEAAPSIISEDSPYYFRYVNDAKYSYSEATYEMLACTTTYRGKTYFFAGLLGLHESERNVFSDARKLTSWAYLNLSDRKIFNAEDELSDVLIKPDWGVYKVGLHPYNSAFKTLPNDYDESKLTYVFDIPESVPTPLYAGDAAGRAKILYDGEEVDDIALTVNNDEGLGVLSDIGKFCGYVYNRLTPYQVPEFKKESESESSYNIETAAPSTEEETVVSTAAGTEG